MQGVFHNRRARGHFGAQIRVQGTGDGAVDKKQLQVWERPTLWALLAIGLALRIYKLDAPLWYDEIMTLAMYVRQPFGSLIADYSSFNNHLFYSLQAKLAVLAFGEQAWALRLPALAFGMGSLWALWRLARTALDAPVAMTATALMALSYHHIWFSQNARGYTELMFWCLLALVIFVEALGTTSRKAWMAFAACLAAAIYTHLTAGFFVATLALIYLTMLAARLVRAPLPDAWLAPAERKAMWSPLWAFVAGGVMTLALCAPALPQILGQLGGVKGDSAIDLMREYQNPLWTLLEGLRTLAGENELGGLMLAAGLAAAAVMALGVWDLFRRSPVIAAVGIGHIVLTLVGLTLVNMRIWPRFFFTDIAFVLLFAANGAFMLAVILGAAARGLRLDFATPARFFALGVVLMVLISGVLAAHNYEAPKQNLAGAASLIARNGVPPAAVGALGRAADIFNVAPSKTWRPIDTARDLADLQPYRGRRWAVVIFPSRTERENADAWAMLARDYELVEEFPGTLGDGAVLVYASKPAGS